MSEPTHTGYRVIPETTIKFIVADVPSVADSNLTNAENKYGLGVPKIRIVYFNFKTNSLETFYTSDPGALSRASRGAQVSIAVPDSEYDMRNGIHDTAEPADKLRAAKAHMVKEAHAAHEKAVNAYNKSSNHLAAAKAAGRWGLQSDDDESEGVDRSWWKKSSASSSNSESDTKPTTGPTWVGVPEDSQQAKTAVLLDPDVRMQFVEGMKCSTCKKDCKPGYFCQKCRGDTHRGKNAYIHFSCSNAKCRQNLADKNCCEEACREHALQKKVNVVNITTDSLTVKGGLKRDDNKFWVGAEPTMWWRKHSTRSLSPPDEERTDITDDPMEERSARGKGTGATWWTKEHHHNHRGRERAY